MNVCVPVTEDRGLQSPVSSHFGSAPIFMLVDTEGGGHRAIPNRDLHHGHGMCHPLRTLEGQGVEALTVGGIGAGAVSKLRAAGIRVFRTDLPTVEAVRAAFRSGALREITAAEACAHHGEGSQGPHAHGRHGQEPDRTRMP